MVPPYQRSQPGCRYQSIAEREPASQRRRTGGNPHEKNGLSWEASIMSAKVIQGSFIGGPPKVPSPVQPKLAALPPIRPTIAPGPPLSAFASKPPAQPAPAFGGRPTLAQARGASDSFHVDPGRVGLVNSGGKPLPDGVRSQMEVALGADFSGVRVHVGLQADRIGAIAFTTGNDIYFAPGRFQPDTAQGRQLLGHELAHVVQQRQGRVRHPPGMGVAVVQDRVLEAEADRLGRLAGAMAQRAGQSKTTGFPVGPPQAASGSTRRSISPKAAAAIQRRIWKYDGEAWNLVEAGSAGGYDPRDIKDAKKNDYFNDITNKKGTSIEEVRAGLADLLLVTGSLNTLPTAVAWPDDVWKGLKQSAKSKFGPAGGDVRVGRVTLAPSGNVASFKLDENDKQHVDIALLQKTWNTFLHQFMEANGQLPYMKRQQWFRDGKATVVVDINFYYNRHPNEAFRFHKDTGGDNLFVNLVFNNKANILATEWIEDLKSDASGKRKALRRNLPDSQRTEIRDTRSAFHRRLNPYRLAGHGGVRGDVVGPAAYVSWVDELVWHSTPAPLSRTGYYKAILTPENYWKYKPYAVEAIRVLLVNGKLDAFLTFFSDKGIQLNDLGQVTTRLCDDYMNAVKSKDGIKDKQFDAHNIAINALAGLSLTDLRPINPSKPPHMSHGVDLDADPLALTDTMTNKMKDTGIRPQVRRRNSVTISDFEIGTEKRSFIRTWVRVHRRDVRNARSAALERQERLRNRDRYMEALDLAGY